MNTNLPLLLLLLISNTHLAMAQQNKPNPNPTQSNFEPSLFIVIGILSLVFFFTFALVLYAKFCQSHGRISSVHSVDQVAMFGPGTRFSGIERSVVESLPFFKFSSLKGSKHGLQCSVCLAEFEETQILRLLPKCRHGFHVDCIDLWLERHSSCPLCRQKVSPEDLAIFVNLSNSIRLNAGIKLEETEEDEGSSVFELILERQNHDHQQQEKGDSEIPTQFEGHKGMIKGLHRLNHQIIISDVMLKNRWSNVSSSDLMFLNSEMIRITSSQRFSSPKLCENDLMREKRAMSEITAVSRFKGKDLIKIRQCLDLDSEIRDREDVIKRKLWFPIAKRTVEWFANWERNRSQLENGHTEFDV